MSKPVNIRLSWPEGKALLEHLKATVPQSASGQTNLEKAHTGVLEAVLRVVRKRIDNPT